MPKISYGPVARHQVAESRRVGSPKRLAQAGVAVVGIAAVMTGAAAAFAAPAASAKEIVKPPAKGKDSLTGEQTARAFAKYRSKGCTVYPNDPKIAGKQQKDKWTIAEGESINWRYNPDRQYAIVQDPRRAKQRGTKLYWGYVDRDCLGGSVGGQRFYPKPGVPVPTSVNKARSRDSKLGKPIFVTLDQRKRLPPPGASPHGTVRVKGHGLLRGDGDTVVGNAIKDRKVQVYLSDVKEGRWVKVCDAVHPRVCGYVGIDKLKLPSALSSLIK